MTSAHDWDDTRIFMRMCRSLAREGHDVHLVACRGGISEPERIDGVTVHPVPAPTRKLTRLFRTTNRILGVAKNLSADVYHFHDPEMMLRILSFQDRVGKPVVYDAHEDFRETFCGSRAYIPRGARRTARWFSGKAEDYVVRRLAGVVTATPHIAERFAYHHHCQVVQNFPSMEEFVPVPSTVNEAGRVDLAYIGAIQPLRGIVGMIESLVHAGGNVRLFMAGRWRPESLREECRRLEGWRQVRDLGFLERKPLADMLQSMLAGLVIFLPVPNHVASQPNKLFEYMAAGLPVVCSHFPRWREFVEANGCGVVVDPCSPMSIAEGIRQLADDPARAREMGARGRRLIEKQWNWECEFDKLLGLYERVS